VAITGRQGMSRLPLPSLPTNLHHSPIESVDRHCASKKAPGILPHCSVNQPMSTTGLKPIDAMVPIGRRRSWRELIVGDCQTSTSKTAVAIDTIAVTQLVPLLRKPLLFSSLYLSLAVPWVNGFVTTVDMVSFSCLQFVCIF
jgi:hypothetical protein